MPTVRLPHTARTTQDIGISPDDPEGICCRELWPDMTSMHSFDESRIARMVEIVQNAQGETVEAVARRLFYRPEDLPQIPKAFCPNT